MPEFRFSGTLDGVPSDLRPGDGRVGAALAAAPVAIGGKTRTVADTLADTTPATLPVAGAALARPTVGKVRERRSIFDFIPWQRHSSILDRTISDDIDLSASLLDAAGAAKEERKAVVFYGGNYPYLTSPNWAGNNVRLITEGAVRFRYTGTGDAFTCDAGPVTRDAQGNVVAPGIFGMQVGSPGSPIIIEAPATAKNGTFIRAIHRSEFSLNVRGCGPEDAAFFIAFGVCTVLHVEASVNNGGWFKGARPGYGIILDRQLGDPADFSAASFLVFPNPKIEGVRRGVSVRNAGGCEFKRGTIEGCIEFGIDLTAASSLCTVDGVDFEANGGFDIRDNGTSNAVLNAQTLAKAPDGTATSGLIVGNTAVGARIEGGAHNSVTVLAGAKGVRAAMFDVGLDGNGSMSIQPGAVVYRRGVFNRQTQTFLPDLGLIPGQGATVRLASGVSVPNNVATILPWAGPQVDSSAPCFSSAQNTRMTVPANSSRVRISAGFLWASNGSGIRQVSIVKNGSEEIATTSSSAHGFNAHSIVSPVLKVVPGDYFEVRAFQNSGGTLGLNFNQADSFQMELVS